MTETAVQYLKKMVFPYLTHEQKMLTGQFFYEAEMMEQKQLEQKDSIISQIDLELSLIEDYAKGEAGNSITLLRKKIDNYYKTNEYE